MINWLWISRFRYPNPVENRSAAGEKFAINLCFLGQIIGSARIVENTVEIIQFFSTFKNRQFAFLTSNMTKKFGVCYHIEPKVA